MRFGAVALNVKCRPYWASSGLTPIKSGSGRGWPPRSLEGWRALWAGHRRKCEGSRRVTLALRLTAEGADLRSTRTRQPTN